MTKRHFQKLAYGLMLSRPTTRRVAFAAWSAARDAVANACAESNPRFDRGRFIAATEARGYVPAMHGRDAAVNLPE